MSVFWAIVTHEFVNTALMLVAAYVLALLSLLVMGGPDAAAAVMPGWLVTFTAHITKVAP